MKIISAAQTAITPPVQRTGYIVGSRLLANLHNIKYLKANNYSSFLLLSDKTVFDLYGEMVISSLNKLGKPVTATCLPSGEEWKNLLVLAKIIKSFFQKGVNRKTCLVALGGGVITDLGGFTASILLRGIDTVYLPTTLLGQVDAAIGGKTGVDFWLTKTVMYKNMIGTIRQSRLVISDVDTLATLPKKELLNGLGEMVKYWIGWNKPVPAQLLMVKKATNAPQGWLQDSPGVEKLVKIIALCQKIKTEIVQMDPFDTLHIREKLNLGHTIGHAIEGVSNGKLSHGQAVTIGLIAAAKISVLKGLLSVSKYKTIVKTIQQLGLPISIQQIDTNQVISALKFDKKDGTFVLIKDIGKLMTTTPVDDDLINQALKEVIV